MLQFLSSSFSRSLPLVHRAAHWSFRLFTYLILKLMIIKYFVLQTLFSSSMLSSDRTLVVYRDCEHFTALKAFPSTDNLWHVVCETFRDMDDSNEYVQCVYILCCKLETFTIIKVYRVHFYLKRDPFNGIYCWIFGLIFQQIIYFF